MSNNPPRTADRWRIHWPQIEPTIARYQEAVHLARVLSEHHAAIAAEPLLVSDPQAPDHAALRAPPLAAKTDNPLNDSGQEHDDREKTTPTA